VQILNLLLTLRKEREEEKLGKAEIRKRRNKGLKEYPTSLTGLKGSHRDESKGVKNEKVSETLSVLFLPKRHQCEIRVTPGKAVGGVVRGGKYGVQRRTKASDLITSVLRLVQHSKKSIPISIHNHS